MRSSTLAMVLGVLFSSASFSAFASPDDKTLEAQHAREAESSPSFIKSLEERLKRFIEENGKTSELAPASAYDYFLNDERMLMLEFGARHIRNNYVHETNQDEILVNMLKGMFRGLDPYSTFFTEKEYEDFEVSMRGSLAGVGAELQTDDRCPALVVRVFPNSPAEKAGLVPNDCIVKVDGVELRGGMPLEKIVMQIRGKVGTKVTLSIVRSGAGLLPDITLVRAIVKIPNLHARMLEPGIGYIVLYGFNTGAEKDVENALAGLMKMSPNGKLRGLIFDLRGNPGGDIVPCVKIADMFLDVKEKPIVTTKGRSFEEAKLATEGDESDGVPIALLVDDGSASASEIVAGALQDYRRAVLVGETTYGKGTVQTLTSLNPKRPEWGVVKYTIAEYFRPSGAKVNGVGIVPDIVIKRPEAENSVEYNKRLCVQDYRIPYAEAMATCVPKDTVLQAGMNALKGVQKK